MITNKLFTERFRPKSLDEIVLLDRVHDIVKNGLQQNILMSSAPGRGKTSLAYILCNVSKMPVLYINASRETSVDIIREKIVGWCAEPSLLDGEYTQMKAVILDEFDGVSESFYKALRGTMEQFADEARFIATCNYLEKIPEPIQSRFKLLNLEPETEAEEKELKKKYYKKTLDILKEVGITTDKDGIVRLTDLYFPDLRALVNAIETIYLSGKTSFTADDIKNYDTAYTDFYDVIFANDTIATYKYVNENFAKRTDDLLIALGNDFIEYLRENKSNLVPKIVDILVAVADHQYKSKFTIDKIVNLLALVFKIQKIVA